MPKASIVNENDGHPMIVDANLALVIVERNGRLYAYTPTGVVITVQAMEHLGDAVVEYDRSIPADAKNDDAWAQELITDISQVARSAASKTFRANPKAARFQIVNEPPLADEPETVETES